jgi:hypothetical protein
MLQKSSRQICQFHKIIYIKGSFSNFVQFLAQNLHILVLTAYTKSSSRSCMDFAESQIQVFYISIFQAKTIAQKYIHPLQKM